MVKQRVLLLGATGATGRSILNALLADSQHFTVSILVRPSSIDKPDVQALRQRDIPIRVAAIEETTDGAPDATLVEALKDIDVLISTIAALHVKSQVPLARAAKAAGVRRFVPSAFASVYPGGAGLMTLGDEKEAVYAQIRALRLPYTLIDVGFWYQVSTPPVPSGRTDYASVVRPNEIHAGGDQSLILIDLRDVGRFVARIIPDERTLNRSVVAYGEVLSEHEIFAIVEEIAEEKVERKQVSAADIAASLIEHKAAYVADPTNIMARYALFIDQYSHSKYVRGDNTPENAKYLGFLNARELYPDVKPIQFREFVQDLLDGKIERPYDWSM
ncbi:Glycoside hydrolase [Mycena indigotica]|uniref:Glycoside hydrolase n=1 Tax=Mycena indigotica TaxID=2126181 RepID=A0A8H6WCV1_9AGAR|nr:Glycoside hydrolase [Mycena indigotica]KAF7310128.1 Glycoside hydrolase [Mycena indigotica]